MRLVSSRPKVSWEDLVERHRREHDMTEEQAVWSKITQARPEAEKLALFVRREQPSLAKPRTVDGFVLRCVLMMLGLLAAIQLCLAGR